MSNRTQLRASLRLPAVLAAVLVLASTVAAQTQFAPYYGKNQPRYDDFEWYHYETDHFIIYYYPAIEPHLERMAGYAESAYQHVSAELRHDLAHKVPLILFQTSSEFQQQNVIPGAAQEGVGAFAEPIRQRIVMPMDEPPDLLYRLIVHELTHQFDYDIIPATIMQAGTPLWVHEGLADYLTGLWRPLDLMAVRDAAVADIVPKMSRLDGYSDVGGARMIYNLGHALYEFIEERWGKDGLREYLFSLRKSVIGGGGSSYEEAFEITAEEFDQEFDRYIKDRFAAFRDKERPSDYGRNLLPSPERSPFRGGYTVEPSPSGDLLAVFSFNMRDGEGDILLVSARDGSVVQNLTEGFDKDLGFEFIATPGGRWITVPWLSWSAAGDRLAYFARAEKSRTLIIQNVLSRNVEQRVEMSTVDDPESPDFSLDGRRVAFAGLRDGTGDIFVVDLETLEITNVTNDDFADSAPTWAPDGRSLVYLARVSGNEKLFQVDLDTGRKTQLTFGTHDDASAQFLDADTLVFPSTATDPLQPIDPDVALNGQIYNVWTLGLTTGELRQYTDAVSGNPFTAVLRQGDTTKIAVITYYKGEYELHAIERGDPIVTAASADFGAPGPIIDFQAPLSHTILAENKHKKGTFEKMFLDGRPPVNVGVTSGGDIFGGTAVTFSDVLGDQQVSFFAQSYAQYRTLSLSYLNLANRFNWAVQGFSQTQFFYGSRGVFYDPALSGFVPDRDQAEATRSVRGGTAFGIWPFNRYRRVELFGGVVHYNEQFNDQALGDFSSDYQEQQFGRQLFRSGAMVPLGVNFVQETTIFREFGPLAGNTMRLSYEFAPKIGDTLSRHTADVDARYYLRLGTTGLLALRARGFRSWGDAPDFLFFGGNSEMRGYDYLEFVGDTAMHLNAELRFPLIEAMLTPIGVLGGIRGAFFANLGGAYFDEEGTSFKWFDTGSTNYTPTDRFVIDPDTGLQVPVDGLPQPVSGFRLVDARASYGIGLETFALGFPVHFDWAWRTLFNKEWEDLLFRAYPGGGEGFRKVRFQVWIGYDF